MKTRYFLPVAILSMFAFAGCGGKKEVEAVPEVKPAVEQKAGTGEGTSEPVVEVPKPTISVEDVASMIGFAARLPKDFETMVLVDVGQFRKLSGLAGDSDDEAEVAAASEGDDEDGPVVVEEPSGNPVEALFRGKVLLAGGPGVSAQSSRLASLFRLFQRVSFRETLIDLGFEAGVISDEVYENSDATSVVMESHFEEVMRVVEGAAPPPVVVALALPQDAEAVEGITSMLDSQMESMIGEAPFVKAVEAGRISTPGFRMYELKAGDVVGREDVMMWSEDYMGEAEGERLYAAVSAITLAFGYGVVDGHLVFYTGSSPEGMKLAESAADSMAARPELEVLADCAGAAPMLVMSASQGMISVLRDVYDSTYVFDAMAEVLRLVTGMGEVRDLVALVESASGHYAKLYAGKDGAFGGAMWETANGWRFEGLGGFDSPTIDGSAPLSLLPAVDAESAMMVVASNADEESRKVAREFVADMIELVEELSVRYVNTKAAEDAEMRENAEWFREKLLPPARVALSALFNDMDGALDGQMAMVVDNGPPVHKIPGLPAELEGKFPLPRVAILCGVEDRAKLTDGWAKFESALKDLWALVPMEAGDKPAWPEAMDSERDGVKSWFYAFSGVTTNDFIPTATVHDEVLVLASSRNLSESLVSRWKSADRPAAAERGIYFRVNFTPLHEMITALVEMDGAEEEDIDMDDEFGGMDMASGMMGAIESLPYVTLSVLEKLESMTLRHRPEGAKWRTSMEIKRAAR